MHIRVVGDPAPQGSVNAYAIRKGGQPTGRVGIRSASNRFAEWRNRIVNEAEAELDLGAGIRDRDAYLFGPGVPCTVEMRFYMPRPKSHFGTGCNAGKIRESCAQLWPMKNDWDKLARAVCDALQLAHVVADDSQFVGSPGVWRVYADYCSPGADIWVEPAAPGIPALALLPGMRRRDFRASVTDFATGELLVAGRNGDKET